MTDAAGTLVLRPSIRHQLGVVLRFVDVFTARPIDAPLDVRALAFPSLPPPPARPPNLPWRAVRSADTATYRFLASDGETLPTGPIDVLVDDPAGAYVNFEPLTVQLPRPFVAHPPTPDRSDFLVDRALWPTRRATLGAGETAVVGRVISAGALTPIAALRIRLGVAPLAPDPYTYTSETGEFVFRLPALKGKVVGTVVTSTASLSIEILEPPAYTTSVGPTSPAFPFVVTLGQVTVMEIRVP
jgi:hypothetical protein